MQSLQAFETRPRRDLRSRHEKNTFNSSRRSTVVSHVPKQPARLCQRCRSHTRQPRRTPRHTPQSRGHLSHEKQKTHHGKDITPSVTVWWSGKEHHAGGNSKPNTSITVSLDFDSKPGDLGTSGERQERQVRRRREGRLSNSLRTLQKIHHWTNVLWCKTNQPHSGSGTNSASNI